MDYFRVMLRLCMVISIIGLISSVYPGFCLADDTREAELLRRIDGLEKRIQYLESKDASPAHAVSRSDVEAIVDEKVSKGAFGFPEALKDITLSGFVDSAYTYNFNKPDSISTNTARVFDTEANSFTLQAAKIALEKLPPKSGGVGFRTDLLFGQDAEVITPAGSTRDQFDLEQAYVDILAPLGKGLDIKLGKFVTMHGAEVIESKDNWNFSRSLLFGYAIPFTHTGVRASYPLLDNLTAFLGLNNGWDNVKDNNKGKSVEGGLGWVATDKVSFNLATMYGPEQAANDHSNRALFDFVATYKPFDKWTIKLNADYAREEDAVARSKAGTWSGVAGYVRYDLNDKMSISNRTEFFSDPDGLRVVAGTPADLWESTLTFELRPYKNLITRLEYRYDRASDKIFTESQKTVGHQSTVGLEAIYVF